jgi:adenosylcobinamide-phosphate synthase
VSPPFPRSGFTGSGFSGSGFTGSGFTGAAVNSWAAALGVAADRRLGEPPTPVHPVALFGRAMAALERLTWRDGRLVGTGYALVGIGTAVAIGAAFTRWLRAGSRWVPAGGAIVVARALAVAGATCVTVAGRGLAQAALSVAAPLDAGDLPAARAALPALVGRDPAGLDEAEILRAVVESVAENTVDAVVAPALWAAVGGASGALGYRAVNTLDAMVGHHSERYERFGWASARIDDGANWIPARVTAALVAVVRPRRATAVWRAVVRDAPGHPSPNAGVAEAAFAAALDLRLGGTNLYGSRTEVRPPLGSGRRPGRGDITAAVELGTDVATALMVGLVAMPPAIWALRRWRW